MARFVSVDRLYEWALSAILVFEGTAMLVWPRMLNGSILRILNTMVQSIGLPNILIPLFFVALGVSGAAALIANGNSMRIGPWTRSICALLRSVVWLTFTLSMVEISFRQGFPSPMDFFFGPLTFVELFIIRRAVFDVRSA